jgi:hypothetical protein
MFSFLQIFSYSVPLLLRRRRPGQSAQAPMMIVLTDITVQNQRLKGPLRQGFLRTSKARFTRARLLTTCQAGAIFRLGST